MHATIEVDRLTKRFGTVLALDDVSFTVRPGVVTGFLGPNGAGKTTTLRLLLGLQRPTSGSALINGRPYVSLARPLRQVGALLESDAAHPARSAFMHLLALARSNGLPRTRVESCLASTGLLDVAHQPVREFSLGMKQRLGLAAAMLGDPPVLVLDEPVNGLDAEGVLWIRQLCRSWAAEGRTVLVSSHLMGEMALTADHLVIVGRGRLLADTPTKDFIAANTRKDVLVRSPDGEALASLLRKAGALVSATREGGMSVFGLDASSIGDQAASHGLVLHELTPRHASLEEAYLDLTRDVVDFRSADSVPA